MSRRSDADRTRIGRRRAGAALLAAAVVAGIVAVVVAALQPSPRSSRPVGAATATHTSTAAGTHTGGGRRRRPRPGPPFRIGVRTLHIDEPSSPGIATGTSAGRPIRALPTLLLYPAAATVRQADRRGAPADAAAAPFPLIVFSQGFDQPVSAYRGLLDAWARAGYVVAAPTYPRTSPGAPGGVDEADILHHPTDLRFEISTLIRRAHGASGPLGGLINTGRIAIAGQSDGAAVTLAAAANSCCRIPAVKAAMILSGSELSSFGGSYYRSSTVPLLVTQGDRDTINLPGCSAALYDQAPEPKYYVDLLGAEHLPPYTEPGAARNYVAAATVAFLGSYLEHDRSPLRRMLRARAVPRVARLTAAPRLAGASTYCP